MSRKFVRPVLNAKNSSKQSKKNVKKQKMARRKIQISQNAHKCALFCILEVKVDIFWQLFCKITFPSKLQQMVINQSQSQVLLSSKLHHFEEKFLNPNFFSVIPMEMLFMIFYQNLDFITANGHKNGLFKRQLAVKNSLL